MTMCRHYSHFATDQTDASTFFAAFGTPPNESKSFPMQNHRAFLGPVLDWGSIRDEKTPEKEVAKG